MVFFVGLQTQLETELEEEEARNKDDIEHMEQLRKHLEERTTAYAEVNTLATNAKEEQKRQEKKQVKLAEHLKHSKTLNTKLEKSLKTDRTTLADTQRKMEENSEKIVKETKKAEDYKKDLDKEEKELEKIRDSLKGTSSYPLIIPYLIAEYLLRLQTRLKYSTRRSKRSRKSWNPGKRRSMRRRRRLASHGENEMVWQRRRRML